MPAHIFTAGADKKTDEHSHNDVHFDGGDPQRAEGKDQSQRDNRQDCIPQRSAVSRIFFGRLFNFHRLDDMSVAFIHIFLREIVQGTDNYKSHQNDGDLIVSPVNYRVQACGFSRQDRTGITGAPVEAQRRRNGCRSRQAADAKTDQDREHGDHQKHGQTVSAVDAQTDQHAYDPGAG